MAPLAYSALGMEIDRRKSDRLIHDSDAMPSLAELTAKGIKVLKAQDRPFFMMVEGGRIDYAAHCNDPVGTIFDTIALDRAVTQAFRFYMEHPDETLIVVAADHETGGMAMGLSLDSKGYFMNMKALLKVKASVEDVLWYVYPEMIKKYANIYERHAAYVAYVEETFGLENRSEREERLLEKAMFIEDDNAFLDPSDQINYGYEYTPTMIAVAHLVSERARIGWTSYVHTSSLIALSAIGAGASHFDGFKDNTDIPRIMAELMRVPLCNGGKIPSQALVGETFGKQKEAAIIPYGHEKGYDWTE